jgi:hypothetical protein
MTFTFTQVLILLGVVVLLPRLRSLHIDFAPKPELKAPDSLNDAANPLAGVEGLEGVAALLARYARIEAHPERLLPGGSAPRKRRRTHTKRIKLKEES